MILQALYQLAQREDLTADPDFEPKPVAWLVRVSEAGKLSGIEGTHYIPAGEEKRKKPRSLPKSFYVPREGGRTSGDRAFFLCDKAEYALGVDLEKDEKKRRSTEKLANRFHLFRERVSQCLEATQDEGIRAIHIFLEDIANGRQTIPLPAECTSSELFAFVFSPDLDRLVTEREQVRSYWKSLRRQSLGGTGDVHCLVSGELCAPGELFPPVKRVPGGTTSGVALVSFNTGAFESYGWKGNENAPISRDASEACATALNRLLHPAYPDPHYPEQTLPKRNLRLGADTVVCFWSARQEDDFSSSFAGLLTANPDEVKELYRSIWRGRPPDIEDPSAFYALTLTGTQGRAIVRDWFEATVAKVAQNLATHFADLAIVRNTPPAKGKEHPPHFPLDVLFEALADPGENRQENIPAPLTVQFIRAAFSGTIYPLAALQRALLRFRAELGKEQDPKKGWKTKQWNDGRAALIKAVLNRRKRFFPQTTSYEEVQREMDPSHPSEGYALGQLMAIIERLQQEALDNVNASVVDRYFSGASASPKSVFVRLLKNARHHVRKAKDGSGKGGLIFLLEKLLDELADRFDPKRNGFPAHLDLDQQGLFVLGYHQMRKWLWMNKEERAEWEKTYPTAPSAYQWSKRETALP